MGKKRPQLDHVRFACDTCGHEFSGAPDRVIDRPEDDWHPWDYERECPACEAVARQDPQERRMLKMWASATGPRTAEGKARSAANLDGHPTPEEAKRTRFNAMRHGLAAKTATYFPAMPGRYSECQHCPYFVDCSPADVACRTKTELFMRHHVAFESGDPGLLNSLRANLQAAVTAIIDDIVRTIITDGTTLRSPAWYYDKEGGFHLAEYTDDRGERKVIQEIKEHPLLKRLSDLLAKNNMSMGDLAMTPKVRDEAEQLGGALEEEGQSREKLLEYQERQTQSLEGLRGLLERSAQRAEMDPVLIEHSDGDDG